MSKYEGTTNPLRTAGYYGSLDTTLNATTNWVDITSAGLTDSTTGAALPAGLVFTALAIHNPGALPLYYKLRARTVAGDPTTGELQVPAGLSVTLGFAGVIGDPITTISYRKGAGGDNVALTCGLELAGG